MALTRNKVRRHKAHMQKLNMAPVNAGSKIFVGSYICREAATAVVIPGDDTAGLVPLGVTLASKFPDDPDKALTSAYDNTDGEDGVVTDDGSERAVTYDQDGEYEMTLDAESEVTPKVGDPAYLVDDDTVSAEENESGIVAGDFTCPGRTGTWFVDISKRRVVEIEA